MDAVKPVVVGNGIRDCEVTGARLLVNLLAGVVALPKKNVVFELVPPGMLGGGMSDAAFCKLCKMMDSRCLSSRCSVGLFGESFNSSLTCLMYLSSFSCLVSAEELLLPTPEVEKSLPADRDEESTSRREISLLQAGSEYELRSDPESLRMLETLRSSSDFFMLCESSRADKFGLLYVCWVK